MLSTEDTFLSQWLAANGSDMLAMPVICLRHAVNGSDNGNDMILMVGIGC